MRHRVTVPAPHSWWVSCVGERNGKSGWVMGGGFLRPAEPRGVTSYPLSLPPITSGSGHALPSMKICFSLGKGQASYFTLRCD